ncbi:MAG: hypothetical protein HXY35_11870 [Chloroflexi bacterium]|nr:hypothetical protein [Chloroflexota bacterium]
MDANNPVVTLCVEGIRAELEDRFDEARLFYQRAWDARTDHYTASIAAHYLARCQDTLEDSLTWNLLALEYAYAVKDERVQDFFPSLYMSLGRSYEMLGGKVQAQRYYRLTAGLGFISQLDSEDDAVKWLKIFFWIQPRGVPK